MYWVLDFEVVCNHWSYRLIVLREDCLEDRKVVLGHLVCNLIENIDELGISRVFAHVKYWWLKTLCNHVIPIQDLLGQYDKD